MKLLHKINAITLCIAMLLYISPYFGMFFQIPLAVIQLILATIITLKYKPLLDYKHLTMLNRYWLMVLGAFIGIALTGIGVTALKTYHLNYSNDLVLLFPGIVVCSALFVIPVFIAFYFGYTTFYITKYIVTNNKRHEP